MSAIPMNDMLLQYERYKADIDAQINEVLASGHFIGGAKVQKFEVELSQYLSGHHVVSCGNGTDALQIALMCLELQPGDEVIIPAFTFGATAETVKLMGLTPVFADVDPFTYNIDPDSMKQVITEHTRCIIPVHLFGLCANMDQIMTIARQYNLFVIEDTAQALGSMYEENDDPRQAGCMGDIGTLSFFPSKNLGCYGDGGAIVTSNETYAEKCRMIKNHGTRKKYYHEMVGINSRLDAIQAGILLAKLPHLEHDIEARIKAADLYDTLLKDTTGILLPTKPIKGRHTFHQYTVQSEDRSALIAALTAADIATAIYYPAGLHTQPAFQTHGKEQISCDAATQLTKIVVSLPIYPDICAEQIEFICQTIKKGY